MREILTIAGANIRKGKASFISIFLLMVIVSMTLNCVLTVNINAKKRNTQALDEAGFGDLYIAVPDANVTSSGSTIQALKKKIQDSGLCKQVKTVPYVGIHCDDISGHAQNNDYFVQDYDAAAYNFKIYQGEGTGLYEERPVLNDGEICVPIALMSLYDVSIGDTISLTANGQKYSYTVAWFFEDPFMGGSVIGIKTLLVNAQDMQVLMRLGSDASVKNAAAGTIFDITKADDSEHSMLKYAQELNKQTGVSNYAMISMSKAQALIYEMLLVNIFSGILAVFIILLLTIAMIVMGHSISSSIELEYVDYGILKAMGITSKKLRGTVILQYMSAAAAGSLVGIPLAIPVVKLINKMICPVVGLFVADTLAVLPYLAVMAAVLLALILYILIKTRRIVKITPVRALAGGREAVYFSNQLQAPIYRKGMHFWLAFRQFTAGIRQYIGMILIAMLLVFFLTMMSDTTTWIGKDGENLLRLFSCVDGDISIQYSQDENRAQVEKRIEELAGIVHQFSGYTMYLDLNNVQMICYIIDTPECYNSVTSGRACLYDNEVLITEFVAKDLGIAVGDTVTVSASGQSAAFMVSGIYQCANDMGNNFAMNSDGYARLSGTAMESDSVVYKLNKSDMTEQVIETLKNEFGGSGINVQDAMDGFGAMESIVTALKGITVLVYAIAAVFIVIIVYMLCVKIFAKEQIDYGIYKAIGITSRLLRLEFALRFLLAAALGSILGMLMNLALSGLCMKMLFSFIGISQVENVFYPGTFLAAALFLSGLFTLCAYWMSGKIARVHTRILISES